MIDFQGAGLADTDEMSRRIDRLENNMESLTSSINTLTQDVRILAGGMSDVKEVIKTFTDVLVKQAQQDAVLVDVRSDMEIAFQQIRKIQENGTEVCNSHISQFGNFHTECNMKAKEMVKDIKAIGDAVKTRDKIAIGLAMLFASGLVTIFYKIIEAGVHK